MKKYDVYWIYAEYHTDVMTQGYVGITCRSVAKRLREHAAGNTIVGSAIRKYGNKVKKTTLHSGLTVDEAVCKERMYRPNKEIGWNICAGGGVPPSHKGKKRPNQSKRMKGENNIAKRQDVRLAISMALKGVKKPHLFGKKRPEHSEKLKKKRGFMYAKFKGYFITPWGEYDSFETAVKHCPTSISIGSLYSYCSSNNTKKISKQALSKSECLRSLGDVLGQTYYDIGFGFRNHG